MALSTRTRTTRQRKAAPVDAASIALETGLPETYTKKVDGHSVVANTVWSEDELLAPFSPADRFRLRKVAAEYREHRPNPFAAWKKSMLLMWLFWPLINHFDKPRSYSNTNATARGGGVSILLLIEIALLKVLRVFTEWDVLDADLVALTVTKCIHNNLQGKKNPALNRQYNAFIRGILIAILWTNPFIGRVGRFPMWFEAVARKDDTLTRTSKLIYRRWSSRNWWMLCWTLAGATDIHLHDWQTGRFSRWLTGWGFKAIVFKIMRIMRGRSPRRRDYVVLFRDHIDTDYRRLREPGPARDTWRYVWYRCKLDRNNTFFVHPVGSDKLQNVPEELRRGHMGMVFGLPAVSGLMDDINRPMTPEEESLVLALLNSLLRDAGMAPIDPEDVAMLVGLISRFDPAKRFDRALAIMVRMIQIMLDQGYPINKTPQGILLGNGSIDDRDGKPVHEETLRRLAEIDPLIAARIRVLRLGHCDLVKNLVLRLIAILMHRADREGWEDVVSCALFAGKPAVVGDNAGPAEQVVHGQSGFVLPVEGYTDAELDEIWAQAFVRFFTDPELRAHMKKRTAELAKTKNIEFTEVIEVTSILWLCLRFAHGEKVDGDGRKLRDIVLEDERYAMPEAA